MNTTQRDPRTLLPAPPDEWWHRGAEMIDNAYAAAHALAEELLAAPAPPPSVAPPVRAGATEKEEGRDAA